jgi:DNA-directed RNA polymerase specialized sigma24 family protein
LPYARASRAGKRGGGIAAITVPESLAVTGGGLEQFLALDQALEQLEGLSPRQAQVIEMRYFGGLNVEEAAGLLNVSPATIGREQRSAEAWLYCAMSATGKVHGCQ